MQTDKPPDSLRGRCRSDSRSWTTRMTRTRVAIACAGVVAIVVSVAFPPFMVIDQAAPETRDAPLGHHPAWHPPTIAAAEEVLTQEVGPPRADTGSSLVIGWSSVLLTLEIVVILVGTCAVWLYWGRGARPRARQPGGR